MRADHNWKGTARRRQARGIPVLHLGPPHRLALLHIASAQPWAHVPEPNVLADLKRHELVEQASQPGQILDRVRLAPAGVGVVASMQLDETERYVVLERWLAHPVGTPVIVRRDDGSDVATTTASTAQLLSGHTPVIWLHGIRGCYLLTRVRLDVRAPAAAEAA